MNLELLLLKLSHIVDGQSPTLNRAWVFMYDIQIIFWVMKLKPIILLTDIKNRYS